MTAREIVEAFGGRRTGHSMLVPCPVPGQGKGEGDRNPSLKVIDGENAVNDRRAELRRMATTRVAAMEKVVRTNIENLSVEAQTELIAGGPTSSNAKEFLAQLPSAKALMPQLYATEKIRSAGKTAIVTTASFTKPSNVA